MMLKRMMVAAAVLGGFLAGVGSGMAASGVTMRGVVMDANTIAEEIEYWEVRSASGESIVITGRRDLPLVRALRQSKTRAVVLTVEPDSSTIAQPTR
jgi:hypothetical protein